MMKYYIVDAFTDQPFGGNPAGVVLLEGDPFPSETLMLQVAAELRYSETAFVRRLSPTEYHVRYFTPKAEVELCGHATIAIFSLLHQMQLAEGECLCHTLAGDLRIEVGEKVMMQMATPSIVATVEDTDEIYRAIGLADYLPTLPVQIAYSGLPDIMISISDVATLNGLQPTMEVVADITQKHKAVSFHVFAFGNDGYTAHVRDFAPLYGVPEESATGTANAALTHYLAVNSVIPRQGDFAFLQGEAMGRPSVVATRIAIDGNIYVGGTAYVLASGEFNLVFKASKCG
ncbi:MAG: PhzF family phenazine biosynthesis protein [Bacteroidales bacterium]|nr:PhzF family phenazine biosynthesis protein [Bacteroidales bacterium]